MEIYRELYECFHLVSLSSAFFPRCVCTAGWTGQQCNEDINECESAPCLNGATCYESIVPGQFLCACPPFYIGKKCQYHHNPCDAPYNPCRNDATCLAQVDGKPLCICQKGDSWKNTACLVHFTIFHSRVNYSGTLRVKFKPRNLWMVKEEHPFQQLNNIATTLGHSLELEKGMVEEERGKLQTVCLGFFPGTGQIIGQLKTFPTISTVWQWNQQPTEVIDFHSL